MNPSTSFEEIEHTADLSLRVRGQDMAQLYASAAQGMFHLMQCERRVPGSPVSVDVALEAGDEVSLLVDWLAELLYRAERDDCCYHSFTIHSLTGTSLQATARGWSPCVTRRGIKAVTYSGLEIVRLDGGYQATITFDV